MLLTEYNEKKYLRMFRKEAWEEGLKEGRETGRKEGLNQGIQEERNRMLYTMFQNGASPEHLSELTGLPLSEIKDSIQAQSSNPHSSQLPSHKKKRRP